MTGVRAAALALALLAGCASLPPPGTLAGRLSLRVDADGDKPAHSLSAGFELRGNARAGELHLLSPLGTTVARASWKPGNAVLSRGANDNAHFDNLAQLAYAALGERIPLEALFDWLQGRPWPEAASAPLDGEAGFEQLGWTVHLARFADGAVTVARRAPPAVSLRAKLDSAP